MSQTLRNILQGINPSLAELTVEIEKLIFVSPRAAMQMMRTMAETLTRHVAVLEEIEDKELKFSELQAKLKHEGILTATADQALYYVRRNGNTASHDGTRKMLIREALMGWEKQYEMLVWFIETYASLDIEVPPYVEPTPIEKREEDSLLLIEHIEALFEELKGKNELVSLEEVKLKPARMLYYEERALEIPHFLRDAFLLPQRFPKSTTFLIRLNGEQQARLMSELPHQLAGLHKYVKRFKETNDEAFFEELQVFVQEEVKRKQLMEQYSGEVLLFHKAEFVILTEALAQVPLEKERFSGQTSLLKALAEQGFAKVGDLPKELVLLGKYPNVGETALANLFNQLKVMSIELAQVELV